MSRGDVMWLCHVVMSRDVPLGVSRGTVKVVCHLVCHVVWHVVSRVMTRGVVISRCVSLGDVTWCITW